jgi:hypothetical protein
MHDDRRAEGAIAILNPAIPRPAFEFFHVVKVKATKEVGTIVGMWYAPGEDADYHWSYRLEGLRTQPHLWWQGEQLRSMQR